MASQKRSREEVLAEVRETAKRLVMPGKGILASDESTRTFGKRLEAAGVENTEENRRAFREVLYTAPGLGEFVSGAILYDETIYQKTSDGLPFVSALQQQGILVGIKVDKGLELLPGDDGETSTTGLDGLDSRCEAYYRQGARFAKWRGVLKITERCPSELSIRHTADGLARYASICQSHGIMPIVEPEILIDGTHSQARSADVAERVFSALIYALHAHHVHLEGVLLKPQMILPGLNGGETSTVEECAALTLRTLQRTIPPTVPGVMFLSGGQSEEDATLHLNALNKFSAQHGKKAPWALSFSFGRALQGSVLRIWAADQARASEAKAMAVALARANSQATLGKYEGPHPSVIKASLFENFRGWNGAVQPPPDSSTPTVTAA